MPRFLCQLLIGVSACGAPPDGPQARGVLLIAIDGLRADHLAVHGYDRDTSPTLTLLAHEGVRFEQAFTSAPQVLPAHAAILTGCEPVLSRRFLAQEFEGSAERRWLIPERAPRLAVEFLSAGYATAAFLDSELTRNYGFAAGFQRYEVLEQESAEDWEGSPTQRVMARFQQWRAALEPGQSWFAYLHLHQLERTWTQPSAVDEGYFPPRAELALVPPVGNTDSVFFAVPRSRFRGGARTLGQLEAAYDGEIRTIDAELGKLIAGLRRSGSLASASVHVVGTYGMEFGESGLYLCAGRYDRADLAVPWIFRPRAGLDAARGRSVSGLVSLLDVAPTLLELEGLAVPRGLQGLSQARVARDPEAPAAERDFVFSSCGLQEGCTVIGERYALEYLVPLGAADSQLRRSWLGEWADLDLEPVITGYDRRLSHGPLITGGTGGVASPPEPELQRLRSAAEEWTRDMNDLRVLLQAQPGRSPLPQETLERLAQRGLVVGAAADER